METMSEETTVLLAREGSKEAFRRLYDGHREGIYRLAFRYLRSAQDSEDVMQETFVRAFRGLKAFDFGAGSSFAAWITKICAHCAIDHLRKARRRRAGDHLSLSELPQEPPSPLQGPDRTIDARRALDGILEAMRLLSPGQQVIFEMRYRQHLDVREIAARVGSSESSVKTQIARSVAKLRKHLEPIWGKP